MNFKRKIFSKSKLQVHFGTHEEDKQNIDCQAVDIIQAETMSTMVHFILQGTVYITDKTKKFVYGKLEKGSCFGDISLLTNEPNKFSYIFNEIDDQNLYLLSIDSLQFMNICQNEPLSLDTMTERAISKNITFESYKKLVILSLMKYLNHN